MHPSRHSRHSCPYRPVPRKPVLLMDGYPQVFRDYELHRLTTTLLRQDRWWAACHHCAYRTRRHDAAASAERSVLDHLRDVHDCAPEQGMHTR